MHTRNKQTLINEALMDYDMWYSFIFGIICIAGSITLKNDLSKNASFLRKNRRKILFVVGLIGLIRGFVKLFYYVRWFF